jgi:hypothetical protein
MAWGKVCDTLHAHKKAARAGLEAMGLWVLAMSWSKAKRTDGFIPADRPTDLADGPEQAARCVDALVRARLWEPVDGGWQFHDWDEMQRTTDEEIARRAEIAAKRAEAGRMGGLAKASNGLAKASNGWQNEAKPSPLPSPPNPLPSESPPKPEQRGEFPAGSAPGGPVTPETGQPGLPGLEAEPETPKAKRPRKPPVESAATWEAYRAGFAALNGRDPPRDAAVNAAVKRLIASVGIETAPRLMADVFACEPVARRYPSALAIAKDPTSVMAALASAGKPVPLSQGALSWARDLYRSNPGHRVARLLAAERREPTWAEFEELKRDCGGRSNGVASTLQQAPASGRLWEPAERIGLPTEEETRAYEEAHR